MRSSATVGLTPQQLLDRRRAQNKLAQRRFREKARMARSAGLDGSASALPSFPPHLDLAAAKSMPRNRDVTPRIRSSSSDSSYASSSASFSLSSEVSSPTSSCTELNTPCMPTFNHVQVAKSMPMSDMNTAPSFLSLDIKPDLALPEANLYMTPPSQPPVFMPISYASLKAPVPHPVPVIPPPSEPVTYSSLASSATSSTLYRSVGLKMIGIHADPFLMSQPLPSPSLPLWPSGLHSIVPGASLELGTAAAPQLALRDNQTSPLASSFENLLHVPSEASTSSSTSDDSSVREHCFSASSPSSLQTKTSLGSEGDSLPLLSDALQTSNETDQMHYVSAQLDQTILEHAQRLESSSRQSAVEFVTIASQPFSSVIKLIGSRFGLTSNGEGLPELLSRLQLYGKLSADAETSKGLVFDAAMDWDAMGSNMLPTTEQLLYPHRAFLDACVPWPAARSRLLKHALTNPVCEEEFALDLLLSVLSSDKALSSFNVHGDDVLDPEAWELSERMVTKWWGLFDDSAVRRTNWWRRQRGLEPLSLPTPDENGTEAERQGLGTGSLEEVHNLAVKLLQ